MEEAFFQRLKKAAYGAYVRGLNSFETLCVEQAQGYFAEQNPWTFPEIYDALTRQDVEEFLRVWIKPEQTSLIVIWPAGWHPVRLPGLWSHLPPPKRHSLDSPYSPSKNCC